jgi:PiT family inorganic phosphate transporter
MGFLQDLTWMQLGLLLFALIIAFGFECVNGFHDTANAVATVIYTKSLKPTTAVVWSGIWNFLGVMTGGIAVAYGIVNLLPVNVLVDVDKPSGLALVLSLLGSAILWNVGTWYFGIPASSSHALIGAILGTAVVHAGATGVNWTKAYEIGLSLLISPLVGFGLAALLLLALRAIVRDERLYKAPEGEKPPPFWIRTVLVGTCTGVSYMHGSNDGQKGMGLIMLILIGIVPMHFALNQDAQPEVVKALHGAINDLDRHLENHANGQLAGLPAADEKLSKARSWLATAKTILGAEIDSFQSIPREERWKLRTELLELGKYAKSLEQQLRQLNTAASLTAADQIAADQKKMKTALEYVPTWVVVGVALALGLGTMVGWKRIVVTVGEKIGKSHLTYAQGAAAELVAMTTIGAADKLGLPVSTTHILSSGVAGTMWANRSGIQAKTIRNIVMAWVLTLPVTMGLSAAIYGFCRLFI